MNERRRMMFGQKKHIAPGYLALTYVTSRGNNSGTGQSFSRTNIYTYTGDNFFIEFHPSNNAHAGSIFGNSNGSIGGNERMLISISGYSYTYSGNGKSGGRFICYGNNIYYFDYTDYYSHHTIERKGTKLYLDNAEVVSGITTANVQCALPMSICTTRVSPTEDGGDYIPAGDYYRFTVYKGNSTTLRADFRPALRESDNVAGFYETVGGLFYPSSTSTPYIAGPLLV